MRPPPMLRVGVVVALVGTVCVSAAAWLAVGLIACSEEWPHVVAGDWTDSADGVLSLRLAGISPVAKGEPFVLFAELRNNTSEPIKVVRPFYDDYQAKGTTKIIGPEGPLRYHGVCETTLVIYRSIPLAPGEIVYSRLELPERQYPDSSVPGDYTVTFTYYAQANWSSPGHPLRSNQTGYWTGRIDSAPITITRSHWDAWGSARED